MVGYKKTLRCLFLAFLFSSYSTVKPDYSEFLNNCASRIGYGILDASVILGMSYILVKYIMPLMNSTNLSFEATVPTTKLSDIVGSHPKELVTFWDMKKNPEKYLEKGINPAHSMLFYGPPGMGKTEYARAIANELDALFYELPSAALSSKWLGGTTQNIIALFAAVRKGVQSRKNKLNKELTENDFLAVLFIDEIDAIGRSREFDNGSGSGETQAGLTTLLAELTKYAQNEHILIIGATNYIQRLDPALTRPGRFDLCIEMPLANEDDRALILAHYCQKASAKIESNEQQGNSEELFYRQVACKTEGFNNAEIRELCNKVAMMSIENDKRYISMEYFDEAIGLMRPDSAKVEQNRTLGIQMASIAQAVQQKAHHLKRNTAVCEGANRSRPGVKPRVV